MDVDVWERKFEVIAQLYREAVACLNRAAPDLLGTAIRARQVIEHIADYLHVREIGPTAQHDMLDAKLKRLAAKSLLSRREQIHFGTVQIHTNFVIHPELVPREQDRRELEPCLASLEIVVDWFFREYLRRPPPIEAPAKPVAATASRPDATPLNATSGTAMHGFTRFGTGFGELVPVWRTKPTTSSLRFDAPEGEAADQRTFKIDSAIGSPAQTLFVGQAKRKDGTPNDFSLPWQSVSRDQGKLVVEDGTVTFTNTSGRKNVFIRGELVPDGESRVLRHGDPIQLGRSVGSFSDGRYYGVVPALAIDMVTGLLSRAGLVTEASGFLASQKPRELFVVRCMEPTLDDTALDAERVAAAVAIALHRLDPTVPVARITTDVAVLLVPGTPRAPYWDTATKISPRIVAGFVALAGAPENASPQLDACLGALSRLAIAGREPDGPEDLANSALVPVTAEQFGSAAASAFDAGGGAALFVLGELERLESLVPKAIPILELELLEMIGARMGPRDVVASAGRGMLAFASPGEVERIAEEVGIEWHARGPFSVDTLEIDRSLQSHLLARSDADQLARRATELARDGVAAFGVGGFPSPIVLPTRALDDTPDPATRMRCLSRIAEAAWQLAAFALVAAARTAKSDKPKPSPVTVATLADWQALAARAAASLVNPVPRIAELASAIANVPPAAMATLLDDDRTVPRVERAVRELLAALAPLRGWTLIAIESSEFDVDGTTQRIEYVDLTGPTVRGARQHVTVSGFRGLGRFVYLVRWTEGLTIALEPFVRRARHPQTGDVELVVAVAPITAAGKHRYRSVSSELEVELEVTAKQVG